MDLSLKQPVPGGGLVRTMSSSHVTPRNLDAYKEMFRTASNRESGWLQTRTNSSGGWEKRWVVFDNRVLTLYDSKLMHEEGALQIPMSNVISIRTDEVSGDKNSILVSTIDFKLYLCASSKDEMNLWLFTFQKSVAALLVDLLSHTTSLKTSQRETNDEEVWLRELGHGHGKHAHLAKKRLSFHHQQTDAGDLGEATSMLRASSDPTKDSHSGWDRCLANRSTLDLTKMVSSTADSSSKGTSWTSGPGSTSRATSNLSQSLSMLSTMGAMAASPAIPIQHLNYIPTLEKKLAGSFVDETTSSTFLGDALTKGRLSLMGDADDEGEDSNFKDVDSIDGDELIDNDDDDSADDDGFMFSMDETEGRGNKSKRNSPVPHHAQSRSSNSKSPLSFDREHALERRDSGRLASSLTLSGSLLSSRTPSMGILGMDCGTCSALGPRSTNEDRLTAVNDLQAAWAEWVTTGGGVGVGALALEGEGPQAFFAVYDGHVGDAAAVFLQQDLHFKICAHPLYHTNLREAIVETCVAADKEFLGICEERRIQAGTTALGAFIKGSDLTVFNIGDCQAVLCRAGEPVVMSDAHKPNRADELERLKLAKGWITEEKELYMGRLHRMDFSNQRVVEMARSQEINYVTIYRVCGEISISRSIGDPAYKGFTPGAQVDYSLFYPWPDDHDQIFNADLLIPVPEFRECRLLPEDEFLVMASDGLWDVITPGDAVRITREALYASKSTKEAAEALCELALQLGSSDNVTVIVVQFNVS